MLILNDNNFNELCEQTLLTLVDVSAAWCGPCQRLTPIIENLAKEKESSLVVYKMDVDESPVLCEKFKVQSVPVLILFLNGLEVKRNVGFISPDNLRNWIASS